MDAYMRVVQGKPRGQYLRFPEGEFVMGRGPECHVRPNSDWVSRQHCLLRVGPSGVQVRDLGSTNGTLVNGIRLLAEQDLKDGDLLQVGPLVLEAVLHHLPDAHLLDTCVISLDSTVNTSLTSDSPEMRTTFKDPGEDSKSRPA